MLPNKIKTTTKIRSMIAIKRKEKELSGADLSSKLNLTSSYISSIENNHIKSISKENLIHIIKILYDVDEDKAIKIIEDSLQNMTDINSTLKNDLDLATKHSLTISHPDKIKTYDTIEDHTERITIDDLMDNIKEGFKIFFKKDPEFTMSTLKRFTASFHFDIGFMMVILRTPYFAFKGLDHEERQKFLNDLSDIFNKYAVQSKEKLDEQDKNIKSESTENDTANNDDTSPESDSGSNPDLQHDDNV